MATSPDEVGASLAFLLLFFGATETCSGKGDASSFCAFAITSPPSRLFSVDTSLSVSLSLDEETANIIQRLKQPCGAMKPTLGSRLSLLDSTLVFGVIGCSLRGHFGGAVVGRKSSRIGECELILSARGWRDEARVALGIYSDPDLRLPSLQHLQCFPCEPFDILLLRFSTSSIRALHELSS
jgi:hypothetical protein